ncbi:MAG: response regulator transcription factor [Deltaproteobacteria bacterium]|nr:response regulator transcription factor [Deltaproteobacteria bacterium]
MGRTILVIEDDAPIRRGVVDALRFSGYIAREAPDGREGLRAATEDAYDLLLLDLVLPGPGGMEILARVRAARPTTPVIILTARGDEGDRVAGLRGGADDYMVKPFSVRELLARVEAVLRRSPERPLDLVEVPFPGGVADLARAEIRHDDGTRHDLPEREAEVLRYLAVHRGRVVSRDELLSRIWHLAPGAVETRTIDMHVVRLRAKIEADPGEPRVIRTVRGRGYLFSDGP